MKIKDLLIFVSIFFLVNYNSLWSQCSPDNEPPTISCVSQVNISLGFNRDPVVLSPSMVLESYSDNCTSPENLIITISPPSVSCDDIGSPMEVVVTVKDEVGNFSKCTSILNVKDKLPPTIACVNNLNLSLGSTGSVTLFPQDFLISATDNCTPDNQIVYQLSQAVFDCNDVGAQVDVVLTATDASGNFSQCTISVNVEDKLPPQLACVSSLTTALDQNGQVTLFPEDFILTVSDNCTLPININYTLSQSSFGCSDAGNSIFVELVAEDASGNISRDTTNVLILDLTPPVINCQSPYNISLGSDGTAILNPEIFATDNCTPSANLIYEFSQSSFDCTDIGVVIHDTLAVSDASGNQSFCIFDVNVEDKLPPVIACINNLSLSLGSTGNRTLFPQDFLISGTDNCTPDNQIVYQLSQEVFDCSDVGAPVDVVLTATDASGNFSQCTISVNVEDKIPPLLECVGSLTIALGANGITTLYPSDVILSISDICTPTTLINLTLSQTTFTCDDIGNNPMVTLTAIDGSGNMTTCTTEVIIVDSETPVISCLTVDTVSLGMGGEYTFVAGDVIDSSGDNCQLSYSFSPPSVNCGNAGKSLNVIVTATDLSGNSSQCTGVVEVIDPKPASCEILPPAEIICGSSNIIFNNLVTGGKGPFTYSWEITKGINDGWAITSGMNSPSVTIVAGTKRMTLELTVTDVCGKSIKSKYKASCTGRALVQGRAGVADNLYNDEVHIYPNPVHDKLFFEVDNQDQWRSYQVVNMMGQVLMPSTIIDRSGRLHHFDVESWTPGIFFLVMTKANGEVETKRFVKK